MAQNLYNFYLEAASIGGVKARTRLSVLTGITSMQANSLEDSDEMTSTFKKAMETIYKEFGKFDDSIVAQTQQNQSLASNETEKLRKHIEVFSDLTAQRALFISSPQKTFERITESAAFTIGVKRASIWLYNQSKTSIVCKDLFLKDELKHESGLELFAKDFPGYFK
ncbi:MAG: hypothetical protein SNJ77_12620, partial [Cytophagales bacterium]